MAPGLQPGAGGSPSLDPLSRFVKVQDLSRGAFGQVVLAQDISRGGELVALKYISRGPQHISKYTEREILNHMKLRHPHVIALQEVFLTATHLVLVMEYAAGGDLAQYVAARQGLCEPEARHFFQQLIVALDYCHRMGVSSRDIKLENVLLDGSPRPLIKLADFGFSKDSNQHSAPSSRVGTPAYLAPEVAKLMPGQQYDGQRADIWSCGVALYVMLTNQLPFWRPSDDQLKWRQGLTLLLMRVLQADYVFPPDRQLSEGVRDLISRILVVDPDQRPTIQDIQRHPWFAEGLKPAVLSYNDSILQQCRERQPPAALLDEVRALVQRAGKGAVEEPEALYDSGAAEGNAEGDLFNLG